MSAQNRCNGFTLVELAIVLIIIGLLIGGTLKGQELITGARATATTSQIRALQAGALTFQDAYRGFPGDLRDAGTKLPGCTGDCIPVTGNFDDAKNGVQTVGNGVIDYVPGSPVVAGQENEAFFIQLFNADLLDGIDGTSGPPIAVGKNMLPAKIGSGAYFRVGYAQRGSDAPNTGLQAGTTAGVGHYLLLVGAGLDFTTPVGTAEGAVNGPYPYPSGADNTEANSVKGNLSDRGFPPQVAQRIDTKYDDGNPNTGSVLAANTHGSNNIADYIENYCASSLAGYRDYNTQNRSNDCAIYARFSP